MRFDASVTWKTGGGALDERVLPLVRSIAKSGSLNRAVAALGMSYRHAWGLLLDAERQLGEPLVTRQRGRGARLTSLGERLLEADEAAAGIIRRELRPVLEALNRDADASQERTSEKPLIIHASHDLVLAELKDLLAAGSRGGIELHFRGSLDSLASLARRECDIAGFHLPQSPGDAAAVEPYRPWLRARDLRLIRFVNRRQGLMVAQGNPRGLLSLADIARKGARFINRQPESGTRLCFDRLLAKTKLRPAQIKGYDVEEFTHAAVAATIASGMADAGFGIEAAARRHGLDFVPVEVERYLLATRAAALNRPATRRLLDALKGTAFARRVAALPGYQADRSGEIITVREALRVG